MKKRSAFKKLLKMSLYCFAVMVALGLGFLVALELSLPDVEALKYVHMQTPLRVFSSDKKLMAEFGEVRRIPIILNQIPKQLIQATIATEDRRFFEHPGVDVFGLGRATIVLLTTGRKKQGGSTITMQVARNFFLTHKKSYLRKFKEILLALKIDYSFKKNAILELYFNKIYYGNRAYGIAAASKIYYGKELNQLTLAEMAMLTGLPKAPSRVNPIANPKAAKKRRNLILRSMLQLKLIDKATYKKAIAAPITAKYHGLKISLNAPYVSEMARQLMVDQFGKDAYEQGFVVYTTIDSQLQEAAQQAVQSGLLAYDQRHGYHGSIKNLGKPDLAKLQKWIAFLKHTPDVSKIKPAIVLSVADQSVSVLLKTGNIVPISWKNLSWARHQTIHDGKEYFSARPQHASDILKAGDVIKVAQDENKAWHLSQIPKAEAAFVTLNPKDGAILALTGGFNYYQSKFNRATQAERQPGSSFKPFIYSAALARGFTLATLINDAPVVVSNSGGENNLWRPENDTQKFYGPTRLRTALNKSRNLVSIRLLQSIGIPYAIDYASRFGFNPKQLPKSLSLALGTAQVTPLKLATGYAVFANGGYQVKPYFIDHIVNSDEHKTIYTMTPLVVTADADNLSTKDITTTENQNIKIAPRVITAQNAYLINSALRDVIEHGTGRRALVLKRDDLAGKTGTTNDQMDAWFSGFNSNIVATAWIGFDKPTSLYEYAAKAALPIWIDFIKIALNGKPSATMPQPPGIINARIDKKTGLLAQAGNKGAMYEIFRQRLAPTQKTSYTHFASNNNSNNDADISQLY
jgi:penicillin-binding protein 1A